MEKNPIHSLRNGKGHFCCPERGCEYTSPSPKTTGIVAHLTAKKHWPTDLREQHLIYRRERRQLTGQGESPRAMLLKMGKRPAITPKEKDRLIGMVRKGYPVTSAAKHVGISYLSALRIIKQAKQEGRLKVKVREEEAPPGPKKYEELSEEAKRGLEDFGFFRERYLGRKSPPWAKDAATRLVSLYDSPVEEYLVLNLPPGAGKTTLYTHDFVVWVIARERVTGKEFRIQLGARSGPMSQRYVGRIRHTLSYNRDLIDDYGAFKPDDINVPWSRDQLLVEPLDWDRLVEKEPTVSGTSQDAGFVGGRFELAIWDDLVDKYNSTTVEARQNLVNIFETEAESRLEPGGLFVLVGSRYGPDDLYRNRLSLVDLEEDDGGEPQRLYKHISYQAHYPEKCDGTNHTGPYPDGCLLDPTRLPYRKLRRALATNESRYRLIYQQEDVDPVGSLADPKWFTGGPDHKGWIAPGCFEHDLFFGQIPRPEERPLLSVITADPSSSKFWAIMHILHYQDGKSYVYRGLRRPMSAPDLLYREQGGEYTGVLEDWWQAGKEKGVQPTYVILEINAAQKYLMQYEFARSWSQSRGVVIVPHTTTINKTDSDLGIETLRPVYREGRFRLPYAGFEERTFADQFTREAVSWPEGATDDLPTAHWFFVFHQPRLTIAEMDDEYIPDGPRWATTKAPKWAKERLERRNQLTVSRG